MLHIKEPAELSQVLVGELSKSFRQGGRIRFLIELSFFNPVLRRDVDVTLC